MAEVPALNMRINIDASGVTAGVQKAMTAMKQLSSSTDKDIVKLRDSFNAFGRTVARSMKIAIAAVGAFALKLGKDAVQAAMDDQKSQALLANALRNTTGATTAAGARQSLGLGSMAVQNSNNISVTGGAIASAAITGGTVDSVVSLNNTTATSATAGSRTLPANPAGFVIVNINGTDYKLPYYNT